MHGAVHGAVQRVLDNPDLMRFDVRTNLFTLVAITGVVLYWRGVWTLWCAPQQQHLSLQLRSSQAATRCSTRPDLQ